MCFGFAKCLRRQQKADDNPLKTYTKSHVKSCHLWLKIEKMFIHLQETPICHRKNMETMFPSTNPLNILSPTQRSWRLFERCLDIKGFQLEYGRDNHGYISTNVMLLWFIWSGFFHYYGSPILVAIPDMSDMLLITYYLAICILASTSNVGSVGKRKDATKILATISHASCLCYLRCSPESENGRRPTSI